MNYHFGFDVCNQNKSSRFHMNSLLIMRNFYPLLLFLTRKICAFGSHGNILTRSRSSELQKIWHSLKSTKQGTASYPSEQPKTRCL